MDRCNAISEKNFINYADLLEIFGNYDIIIVRYHRICAAKGEGGYFMINADFTVTAAGIAYYRKYRKGQILNMKKRPHSGLTLILSGELTQTFPHGHRVVAGSGDILLQSRDSSYLLEATGAEGSEYIVLSYLAVPREIPEVFLPREVFRPQDFEAYRVMFEETAAICSSAGICQKTLQRAKVQAILCAIIQECERAAIPGSNDPEVRARLFIEENYSRPLCSEDIAGAAGICTSHLRKRFAEAYGETPIRYLNRFRIERAKELIASHMFRLEEVAEACGFRNEYYFNRVFREYTGTTPGKY